LLRAACACGLLCQQLSAPEGSFQQPELSVLNVPLRHTMRQRHNKNMQAPGAKYSAKGKGPCSAIVATHSKHQASDSSAYLHCSGPAKLSRSPTAAAEALSFSRYRAVRNVTCTLQGNEQSPFCTLLCSCCALRQKEHTRDLWLVLQWQMI